MRKVKMGLITLAASAAVLVPASAATANPHDGLINACTGADSCSVQDITFGVQVCGVNAAVLAVQLNAGPVTCNQWVLSWH